MIEGLTLREQELMHHLSFGSSNEEIGKAMCLTNQSVRNLITNLREKLNLDSTRRLVALAAQELVAP